MQVQTSFYVWYGWSSVIVGLQTAQLAFPFLHSQVLRKDDVGIYNLTKVYFNSYQRKWTPYLASPN